MVVLRVIHDAISARTAGGRVVPTLPACFFCRRGGARRRRMGSGLVVLSLLLLVHNKHNSADVDYGHGRHETQARLPKLGRVIEYDDPLPRS